MMMVVQKHVKTCKNYIMEKEHVHLLMCDKSKDNMISIVVS